MYKVASAKKPRRGRSRKKVAPWRTYIRPVGPLYRPAALLWQPSCCSLSGKKEEKGSKARLAPFHYKNPRLLSFLRRPCGGTFFSVGRRAFLIAPLFTTHSAAGIGLLDASKEPRVCVVFDMPLCPSWQRDRFSRCIIVSFFYCAVRPQTRLSGQYTPRPFLCTSST